jgi:hypothetical protein
VRCKFCNLRGANCWQVVLASFCAHQVYTYTGWHVLRNRLTADVCCCRLRTCCVLQVGCCETSPNQQLLAWTEDTVGGEKYTLHVKVG